jgi:penicillin amidase
MNRLTWLLAGVVTLTIIAFVTVTRINQYQSDGQLHVDALQNPVEVIRDEKGMAYIRAENLLDAIKAQGFITAQDRLFQMQLTKVLVQGRLAEVFGEAARDSDLLQRTLGFYRAAHKHAALLDDPTRQIFESYAEGVNQYIEQMQHEHPLELRLAGLELEPWQIIDSLAIIYYMGWGSAANIQAEIISQKLIEKLGYEAFMTLSPVNINPEDKLPIKLTAIHQQVASQLTENGMVTFAQDPLLDRFTSSSYPLAMGSNNWVMAAEHASGGKPIVVNDPHLSTRILPTTLILLGCLPPM